MSGLLKAWKEKRKAKQRARLGEKGKLVASEYMKKTGEGTYSVEPGAKHGHTTVTDPKNKVKKSNHPTQYKVSRKGKIKKEV